MNIYQHCNNRYNTRHIKLITKLIFQSTISIYTQTKILIFQLLNTTIRYTLRAAIHKIITKFNQVTITSLHLVVQILVSYAPTLYAGHHSHPFTSQFSIAYVYHMLCHHTVLAQVRRTFFINLMCANIIYISQSHVTPKLIPYTGKLHYLFYFKRTFVCTFISFLPTTACPSQYTWEKEDLLRGRAAFDSLGVQLLMKIYCNDRVFHTSVYPTGYS